jgi:hypothetical protein
MVKVLMEQEGEAGAGVYRQLKAMTARTVAVERGHTEIVAPPMDCVSR